jgi:hypothetical protein
MNSFFFRKKPLTLVFRVGFGQNMTAFEAT